MAGDFSIPKIIHYCWFGAENMDRSHKKCLQSWKKYLPDYICMKWDESNINFAHHPFLKAAYEMKKWAFVADYIRLQKLYEFGGIYLDTDILILRPLEELLNQGSFFGAENPNFINGAIFGTKKKNPLIKECLVRYDRIVLDEKTPLTAITIPQIITTTFRSNYNYEGDFTSVVTRPGITIYPPIYFYSLPYKDRDINNKMKNVTSRSYAIHLWDESWKDLNEFQLIRKRKYLRAFNKFYKKKDKDYSYKYFKNVVIALIKSRI